jgi:hypothetical protein
LQKERLFWEFDIKAWINKYKMKLPGVQPKKYLS